MRSLPSSSVAVHTASIIIPALNEEKGIGFVLDAIHALGHHFEVIVVDDGSTDQTGHIATQHGAKVVKHPVRGGYGRSLKDGIAVASHDTVVITDADGTYPIDQIPALLTKLAEGFDMVVGARHGKAYRGSFFKMPARIVFKFLAEFTTGRRIPDVNSGLRAFRKSQALVFFPDICDGFSFTTTITLLYQLTGKFIAYIPIAYDKRIGKSKVRTIQDSLRTLQYMAESIVRYNPLKLFLLLSAFTFLVSALMTIFLGLSAVFYGFLSAILIFALGLIAELVRSMR